MDYILAIAGIDNYNNNNDGSKIFFYYNNQKLLTFLRKGFGRSDYRNKYKTKLKNKSATIESIDFFSNQTLL